MNQCTHTHNAIQLALMNNNNNNTTHLDVSADVEGAVLGFDVPVEDVAIVQVLEGGRQVVRGREGLQHV